jgi:hypothetical protein
MNPENDGVTTGAALLLAVAAVMSTPCQAPGPSEASRWLQLTTGPAAAEMAGAIAEHPENFIAP